MSYIGIDLSLTGTGVCALDGPDHFTRLIKTRERGYSRRVIIKERILGFLTPHTPDLVAIEGYSFGSRSGQAFSIGELGGVIKELLGDEGYKCKTIIVPPTCLKKFITGKGNSSKDVMMMKTFRKYGVEFTDNNLCDAYGLAKMCEALVEGTVVKYEEESLKKVKYME